MCAMKEIIAVRMELGTRSINMLIDTNIRWDNVVTDITDKRSGAFRRKPMEVIEEFIVAKKMSFFCKRVINRCLINIKGFKRIIFVKRKTKYTERVQGR